MNGNLYINGRFLTQQATGVQRVAEEMVKAFDDIIGRDKNEFAHTDVCLLAPRRPMRQLHLKHIRVRRVGRLSGHLWEQLEIPRFTRDGYLINLCNTGPMYKNDQLIFIHDAGFRAMPDSYTFRFRAWYNMLIRCLGRYAQYIVTVTDFSRRELIDYFSIPMEKVHIVHNSGDHMTSVKPDDSILEREQLSTKPYLLAVSSLSPRKNFTAAMHAIKRLNRHDFNVVIVGEINTRVFGDYNLQFPGHARCLGYVTDEELCSLYSHATAFIYPSLYEGFGLPPLEAMTCGCPVIVSDIPPHREVCGDAAIYVNPSDIDDIADKINLVMNDADLRCRLTESGRRRQRMFNWHSSATALLRILKTGRT